MKTVVALLLPMAATVMAFQPSASFRPSVPFRRSSVLAMSGAGGPAITVVGGSGFVGSRVCKALVEAGADVTSVSKGGAAPSSEEWTKSVKWRSNDLVRGSREKLAEAIGTPSAVVSCVGTIGFDVQGLLLGNGVANAEAAKAAKAGGAKKFVYISVASEVSDSANWLPAYFKNGYFQGKADAEAAILDSFGEENVCFVKPSFIYGGDSFGLFPPRVNYGYGSAVEELLSKDFFRFFADLLPGLLGVALRPPVSVDAIANACAGAALGTISANTLDGTAAINEATNQPAATGLTDFAGFVSEKFGEAKKKVQESA